MSATVLFNPPPTPGVVGLQVGSCVPSGVVNGDPMFSPCPGTVMQLAPSVRPAVAQVEEIMLFELTPAPGNVRNDEAMLPDGASASNAGVSYQPVAVTVELFRCVS